MGPLGVSVCGKEGHYGEVRDQQVKDAAGGLGPWAGVSGEI